MSVVLAALAGGLAAAAIGAGARPVHRSPGHSLGGRRRGLLVAVGGAVRQRCGLLPDEGADRAAGAWAGVVVASVAVAPLATPVLAGSWWAAQVLRHRRATSAARDAVLHELPDVVDLLRLATGAGVSLPLAIPLVARHGTGEVRRALLGAHDDRARPLADTVVSALDPLGPGPSRLGRALADHLRYGVALDPALARVGLEARAERRRHGEVIARRIPVRLLLPLVLCVLPAFGLLTVVPLLAGSLQDLLA